MFEFAWYSTTWLLLINAVWLMYLGAHRPVKLDKLIEATEDRRRFNADRVMPKWRASAHLILGLVGAFCAALFVYRAALGFIPYEWGGTDADGEFQPIRDTLAGLMAFGTAYLAAHLVNDGGQLRHKVKTMERDHADLKDDLKEKQNELDEVLHDFRALEGEFEAAKTMHFREVDLLKDDVRRLRSLVSPEVLAEEDRKAAERANAPPKVYWS